MCTDGRSQESRCVSVRFIFLGPSGQYTLLVLHRVSALLHTLLRRNLPLRSSAATLHVVGPSAGLAAVFRVRFLSRPSRLQRPSDTSSWSESPARRPRVARVVVAQPVWAALRPSGLAGSRAHLSSARIGSGVVGLEFLSPLIPIRLLVVLALPARRPPSDESWRPRP